jgi:hypothetical protein
VNTDQLPRNGLIAAGVAAALLTARSAAPTRPDGAGSLRSRLTQLQSNPEFAGRAPLAMREADIAVRAAETPQVDKAVAAHLIFMADRKVAIAEAQAENQFAVEGRRRQSRVGAGREDG